jgi:hypothetical protein
LFFVFSVNLRLWHGKRCPGRGRPQAEFCQDGIWPGATRMAWVVAATGGGGTTGLFTTAVWRASWVVAVNGPGPNRRVHHDAVLGVRVVAAAIVTAAGSGAGTRRRPMFVFLL